MDGRRLKTNGTASCSRGGTQAPPRVVVREGTAVDVDRGLVQTLSSLADVALSLDEAREVFRGRLRLGIRTYVAVVDEQVIGTTSLLVEQKFIHHGGKVGHIEDVAVHRDFQGRGVARGLIEHAVQEAWRLGCYKVILNCRDELVPFYERFGFRRHDNGMRLDL
jgi:glucosamine-phosphate N-acetyltransferase